MSDSALSISPATAPASADDAVPAPLTAGLHRTFLSGASLEMPQGAALFSVARESNLKLNIEARPKDLGNGFWEVTLRATLEANSPEGASLYLLEVAYSGIFQMQNGTEATRTFFLEVSAPTILMPHLRAQVADMLVRATLQVFYLPEMDWAAAVAQRNKDAQPAGSAQARLMAAPLSIQ